MKPQLTDKSVRDFVREVSDQHYPLSSTVLANSAAQATALGEACMQISLEHQIDTLSWQEVAVFIEQMVDIKNTLLDWADQEVVIIASHAISVPQQSEPNNLHALTDAPAEIARLSLEAIKNLQNFRPMAYHYLEEQLEVAIHLLTGTTQAAISLLACHLHYANTANHTQKYGSVLADLQKQVEQLTESALVGG